MNTEQALQLGFQQLNNGNLPLALQLFQDVLQREPENFSALNGRGYVALQQNLLLQSAADFKKSLSVNPRQPFAYKMLGIVQGAMGQFDASMQAFMAALTLDANDYETYFNRANFKFQAGELREALEDLSKAIALREDYLEARSNRANLLIQLGDFAEAEKDLDYLVTKVSDNPDYWVALGLAKHKVGKHNEATLCNHQALQLTPNHADALLNNSSIAYDQGDYETALEWADEALKAKPNRAEAHYAKGQALLASDRFDLAIREFESSVRLSSVEPTAFLKLGACYAKQGRFGESVKMYRHALALTRGASRDHVALADALMELGRVEEAVAAYNNAIDIDPKNGVAFNNLGVALEKLRKMEDALGLYLRAIELDSKNARAIFNAAGALAQLNRFGESVAVYARGCSIDSTIKWILGDFLFALSRICGWHLYKKIYSDLTCRICHGEKVSNPFPLLSSFANLDTQLSAARIFSGDKYGTGRLDYNESWQVERVKKLRVAYLSSDFYNHATSYLMAELFELHDRDRFDVIGISYGYSPQDEMKNRISKSFDKFVEVADKSDQEIANILRGIGVDIAVDLKGHTQGGRLGIFAERVAPVQLHYLGYPGTLGADFVDYLVADPILIPKEDRQFYTEKIIYLPDTYQVNDRSRKIASKDDSRSDHGLPERGFVYCCFNNNWKITQDVFDVWMRVLQRVDGSVLWLFEDNADASRNLKDEAEKRGVSAERLIFAQKVPLDEHLARHRHADLFLDTLYYNAHTTASDALWAGLPLVSKLGETFAGRVGASLLNAIGLPELVAESIEAYEALAIDFAMNPTKLAAIRQKLADNRSTATLFDSPRFTSNLEKAYEAIWWRYQQGLAPDHIYVCNGVLKSS